jgi:uncharacterized protein (TIGR04222 family)
MFNPFDLYGPEFLLFFIVSAVGLNLAFYLWIRWTEPETPTDSRAHALMHDPYMIAYLRGGASELIKVAIFGMSERGLLQPINSLVKSDPKAIIANSNVVERQIAAECVASIHVHDLPKNRTLCAAVDQYAQPLQQYGLIASDGEYRRRLPMGLLIAGALMALAVGKIMVALTRGRHNLVFLIMLAMVALIACQRIYKIRGTKQGAQLLAMQQALFARLKNRISRLAKSGATNEAILVAAAFGFSALPKSRFPLAHLLRRDPRQNSGSSSCSSSCSSSSCGGGCGGGCGGCGS